MRADILRIRAERQEVALKMDAVRIRHEQENAETLVSHYPACAPRTVIICRAVTIWCATTNTMDVVLDSINSHSPRRYMTLNLPWRIAGLQRSRIAIKSPVQQLPAPRGWRTWRLPLGGWRSKLVAPAGEGTWTRSASSMPCWRGLPLSWRDVDGLCERMFKSATARRSRGRGRRLKRWI